MEESKNPLVSVVLCAYNSERYISEAIDSVLCQTFRDFEFIIWNDGSTDRTEDIVKSYDDQRIRYFYHENLGVGGASHKACEKARGKYIAKIDGDDIAMPNRLQEEVNYLEKHPSCVLVSSSVVYINDVDDILGRSFPYTWNFVLKRTLRYSNPFSNSSCMYRRDAYISTGGYYNIRCSEDYLIFRKLSEYGHVHNLSIPLLKYRLSHDSLSHSLGNFLPLLREIVKLLAEDRTYSEELVKIYNDVYLLAKKDNCIQTVFYRRGYINSIYRLLSIVLPQNVAGHIITFSHNIIGFYKSL